MHAFNTTSNADIFAELILGYQINDTEEADDSQKQNFNFS